MKYSIAIATVLFSLVSVNAAENPVNARALSGMLEAPTNAREVGIEDGELETISVKARGCYSNAMDLHGLRLRELSREVRRWRNDPVKLKRLQEERLGIGWTIYQSVRTDVFKLLTPQQQRRIQQLTCQAFIFQRKLREAFEVAVNRQATPKESRSISVAVARLTTSRMQNVSWQIRSAHLASVAGQEHVADAAGKRFQLPKLPPVRLNPGYSLNRYSVPFLTQAKILTELKLTAKQHRELVDINLEIKSLNKFLQSESIAIGLQTKDEELRNKLHDELSNRVAMEQAAINKRIAKIVGDKSTRAHELLFQFFVLAKQPVAAAQFAPFELTTEDIKELGRTRVIYDRKEWEAEMRNKIDIAKSVLGTVMSDSEIERAIGEWFEPRALFGGKMYAEGIEDKPPAINPRRRN